MKTQLNLNKKELAKVLETATSAVEELLKSESEEGERLSKADEGEETPAEKTPAGSSMEEPSADGSETSSDGGGDSGPPEGSADAGGPPPEASAGADGGGDLGGDVAEETPEQIQAALAQLPIEKVKMLFLASRAIIMASGGAGDGAPAGGPDAGGPPPEASAGPGGPPPGPGGPAVPPEGPPGLGKKEFKTSEGSGGKISAGKLAKSELTVRLDDLEKANNELRKSNSEKDELLKSLQETVSKVASGFEKVITRTQAMRKSISGVSYISRHESNAEEKAPQADFSKMTKSQVVEKLKAVTASPSLTKADRDAINSYVVGTNVSVETVKKFLS
jgi:hypothetical protein